MTTYENYEKEKEIRKRRGGRKKRKKRREVARTRERKLGQAV